MNSNKPGMRILLAILAGALILGMLVLIAFKVEDIKKSSENLVSERVMLGRDEETLARLEKLKENEDELTMNYDRLSKLMPEKPDEDGLIKYLQVKAEESTLKFSQVRFGPRVNKSGYMEMPMELSFTGSYKDLLEFLELIADGERAIRIDTLKIIISPGDGSGQITANISAYGFCRSDGTKQ